MTNRTKVGLALVVVGQLMMFVAFAVQIYQRLSQ